MSSGMEMSRKFFEDHGMAMINNQFPEYVQYMAVGLAGEGSECLGFDDEISRDHDFVTGFCIWLPHEIYKQVNVPMQQAYDKLPKTHFGLKTGDMQRHGVQSVENFYRKYLGIDSPPATNMQWLNLSEENLAIATSGKVFFDNCGEFSNIRKVLQGFYPRDVMIKKLAARLFYMGQSGQYNYARCIKRNDEGGAFMCKSQFVKFAVSALHLMAKKYTPFYKWSFKSLDSIAAYSHITAKLKELAINSNSIINGRENENLMQKISEDFALELQKTGLSSVKDDFLVKQAEEISQKISDEDFRLRLPVPFDLHM